MDNDLFMKATLVAKMTTPNPLKGAITAVG
jgi:hypothetical protein